MLWSLKSYTLPCKMDFLPMYHFVMFCIVHLENIGLLNYIDFPGAAIFHFTPTKVTAHLISKISKYREAVKLTVRFKFSKILIFAWELSALIVQKMSASSPRLKQSVTLSNENPAPLKRWPIPKSCKCKRVAPRPDRSATPVSHLRHRTVNKRVYVSSHLITLIFFLWLIKSTGFRCTVPQQILFTL